MTRVGTGVAAEYIAARPTQCQNPPGSRRVSSMRFARQRIGRASLQAIYDHLVP